MAFNKKSNVVKYRSFKCIGLLILCITCLLSLNLSLNASAIRKNIYGLAITHASYNTENPNGTVTDLQLNKQWHPLTTVDIPANSVFKINRLTFKFGQDYTIKKNKKYEIEITYYTSVLKTTGLGNATYLNNAMCPTTQGGWVIDECNTTIETLDSATDLIYTPGLNQTIGDAAQLDIQSHIMTKYVIKIKGHWKNNDTTIRYYETIGASLSIFNTTPLSSGTGVWYSFNVPVFNVFDEQESAEEEVSEKELQGTTNIENQSTNDVSNPTNQQTTSLVGTISSFVGAFSNISPAANCNLTLPFPEFLGGDTTVNICTGADKAPTLIAAGSSLLLIITFIPLAFIMLRMIYNEIRSFTNG